MAWNPQPPMLMVSSRSPWRSTSCRPHDRCAGHTVWGRGREAASAAAVVYGCVISRTRRGWQLARHANPGTENCVTDALLQMPAELAAFRKALARSCGALSDVEAAVDGLSEWRLSLLDGQVPAGSSAWPPEPLRKKLLTGIQDIELPALLSEQPELVDTVLLNILQAVEDYQQAVASSGGDGDEQSGSSPSMWSLFPGTSASGSADPDAELSEAASAASQADGDADSGQARGPHNSTVCLLLLASG